MTAGVLGGRFCSRRRETSHKFLHLLLNVVGDRSLHVAIHLIEIEQEIDPHGGLHPSPCQRTLGAE